MGSIGLLTIMAMLVQSNDPWPTKIVMSKHIILCSNITAIVSKQGYPYHGITTKESKTFMTDTTDVDLLDKVLTKACR